MTLALSDEMTIKPEDFDPPLKRKEAAVPYYWTVEELAEELGVSTRYVHYLIKGDLKRRIRVRLKAYNAGKSLLIPEQEALQYLWEIKQVKKKN
ncbi:DNA-binding protein [Aphanothece hegewaldii CCALA 016]|uniref:DNA-binding protein n=1 Tax=Aphanothece hegewaldii CCALA 016 TaxID=2107694 RepID=A0A2T1LU56_9CHRO|nr:helix-turn-helix domain-containing protein [Aphanothece hegewaldii]PSF34924.1 DNA-binding protein [Aphanothece hegewaldii CCALA 016]